jgi:hypothetical protein
MKRSGCTVEQAQEFAMSTLLRGNSHFVAWFQSKIKNLTNNAIIMQMSKLSVSDNNIKSWEYKGVPSVFPKVSLLSLESVWPAKLVREFESRSLRTLKAGFQPFFIPKNIEGTIEKTVVFFEDSRHFQRLFNRTLRESFIYARTSACETDGERLFLGDRPHGSPQGPAGAAAPVGCDSMTSVLVLWHGKKWSMYF